MQVFMNSIVIIGSIVCISISSTQIAETKRVKTSTRCQLDECDLRPQHFALYSFVKRAIDTELDISGKEIYPLLKSIEVLRRRFSFENPDLNSTKLVHSLLADKNLLEVEKVFKSEQGSALVDLYRSSVNGRSQNLACSQLRVQALERANSKLESNQQLAQVFNKINRNFVRKSAKRCLKHSCNSIETSMSKLQSVLGKKEQQDELEEPSKITNDIDDVQSNNTTNNQTVVSDPTKVREFELEELELCRFFKRTNETDCKISGHELSEISLIESTKNGSGDDTMSKTNHSMLGDLLATYRVNYNNNTKGLVISNKQDNVSELVEMNDTGRIILAQCRPLRSLLDYNLAAIKWYKSQGLIDNQKLTTRSFWCPSLAYWLQLDRLCGELESSLESFALNGTFAYEVSDKHFPK